MTVSSAIEQYAPSESAARDGLILIQMIHFDEGVHGKLPVCQGAD